MTNTIKGFHCKPGLPLSRVLKKWIALNSEIAQAWVQDVPWWYNERAAISIFAGAVWRSGNLAFEEFVEEKRAVSRDMEFLPDNRGRRSEGLGWHSARVTPDCGLTLPRTDSRRLAAQVERAAAARARKVHVKANRRFSDDILDALHTSRILGLRAGGQPHRFIGVWVVVVNRRVFVRSWNNKPQGWYRAFLEEPHGVIQIAGRELPVRARKARGERLMDAIDLAYREKYPTPGSRKYVEGFACARRRATTMELVPW